MRISLGRETIWFDVVGAKEAWADGERTTKPTLVFVHGGGGTHRASRPWAERLADVAQCVILDLPGHGRSSRSSPERWTLADWADVLAEFCGALGIRRPIFHGASMGGFVVQSVAVRDPELAAGLILAATYARRDRALTERRFLELGGPEAAAAAVRSWSEPQTAESFEGFMRHCMPLYSTVHGDGIGALLARSGTLGPVERTTLARFSEPGGEFDTFDFRGDLAQVTTPTLIIAGAKDPIIPLEAARELHASFRPGVARLEVLERASHILTEDQSDDYLRLVRAFVSALRPEGGGEPA